MSRIHWYKIAWSTWAISVILDLFSWLPVSHGVRLELRLAGALFLAPIFIYVICMFIDLRRAMLDWRIRRVVLDVLTEVLDVVQEAKSREEAAAKVQTTKKSVKRKGK